MSSGRGLSLFLPHVRGNGGCHSAGFIVLQRVPRQAHRAYLRRRRLGAALLRCTAQTLRGGHGAAGSPDMGEEGCDFASGVGRAGGDQSLRTASGCDGSSRAAAATAIPLGRRA